MKVDKTRRRERLLFPADMYVTMAVAARILNVKPQAVYHYACDGALTVYMVGSTGFFLRSEVEKFRDDGRPGRVATRKAKERESVSVQQGDVAIGISNEQQL